MKQFINRDLITIFFLKLILSQNLILDKQVQQLLFTVILKNENIGNVNGIKLMRIYL